MCVSCSTVSNSLCDPTDYIVHQTSLSLELSSQEYWIGLPFPSPGDIPNPGIEPRVSRTAGRCFTIWGFLGLPWLLSFLRQHFSFLGCRDFLLEQNLSKAGFLSWEESLGVMFWGRKSLIATSKKNSILGKF